MVCREARRELGLMRHTCLACMLVKDDGTEQRESQTGRRDSSFIYHNSLGASVAWRRPIVHSSSLTYNLLCPTTCPCDMLSTRAFATHTLHLRQYVLQCRAVSEQDVTPYIPSTLGSE